MQTVHQIEERYLGCIDNALHAASTAADTRSDPWAVNFWLTLAHTLQKRGENAVREFRERHEREHLDRSRGLIA